MKRKKPRKRQYRDLHWQAGNREDGLESAFSFLSCISETFPSLLLQAVSLPYYCNLRNEVSPPLHSLPSSEANRPVSSKCCSKHCNEASG